MVFGRGRREREFQAQIDAHVEADARDQANRDANLLRVKIGDRTVSVKDSAEIRAIITENGQSPL